MMILPEMIVLQKPMEFNKNKTECENLSFLPSPKKYDIVRKRHFQRENTEHERIRADSNQ